MSLDLSRKYAAVGTKLALSLGLALVLAACGQRGPLVPPTVNTNSEIEQQEPVVEQRDPDGKVPTKAPDRKFILDGLL